MRFTCSNGHHWELPDTSINSQGSPPTFCIFCGVSLGVPSEGETLPPPVPAPDATPAATGSGTMDFEAATLAPAAGDGNTARISLSEVPEVPGYELLEELGRGGMGVVYRARQITLNRVVALKMILAGGHATVEERVRFRAEAEAVAQLRHRHIVQIHEVGEVAGCPFFSLEYVPGGSLAQRLGGTPLAPREAARLVALLARAIQVAHEEGIVHRDLKPANILLDHSDHGPTLAEPRITDFGLAKRTDADSGQTRTGAVLGTPGYMSPEQAGGKGKTVGPATDIYALGAILHECLTGRPPFAGPTPLDTLMQVIDQQPVPPRLLTPTVPRDLDTVCLKCLEKDPAHRYPSAANLAEDLERFDQGESISVRSINVLDRLARTLERSPLDTQFHSWSTMCLWFALSILFMELGVFWITREGPPYPHERVAVVRMLAFVGVGWAFARQRKARYLPGSAAERLMWTVWIGFFVGCVALVVAYKTRAWLANTEPDEMVLYPQWSVLSGLCWFIMGSNYWGRGYAFGLAFFVLAMVLPWKLGLGPLGFGLLWSGSLLSVGLHLRKLGEQTTESVAPETEPA